jgi:hypothetical protein
MWWIVIAVAVVLVALYKSPIRLFFQSPLSYLLPPAVLLPWPGIFEPIYPVRQQKVGLTYPFIFLVHPSWLPCSVYGLHL